MAPDMWGTVSRGGRFDDEQNRQMLVFMRGMLSAMKACGAECMECYHALAWDRETVTAIVEELWDGEIWAVHAPYGGHAEPSVPDPEIRRAAVRAIAESGEIARRLGAGLVVVHPGASIPISISRGERLHNCVESLKEAADELGELGIRMAVEPLPKDEPGNSFDELARIVEGVGRPNVGVCLDTNHLFPQGSLPGWIRKLGPLLLTVHTSDHDGENECHWLPFSGVVEWGSVIRALVDIGYAGPVIYESWGSCNGTYAETAAAIEDSYLRLAEVIRDTRRTS
jgi:sugar phosphate isomerase/epimerase